MSNVANRLEGRVLVVDDVADAAASLGMVCELYGAEVQTAHDGQQALRLCAQFQPNIVLMDITMPNMNGYQAAQHIRQAPWGRDLILIALTGWGRPSDIEAARAAGFDGHLLKPVEPDALLRLIHNLRPVVR